MGSASFFHARRGRMMGMNLKPDSRTPVVGLSAFLIACGLALLLAIYVTGYFLASYQDSIIQEGHRAFETKSLAIVYAPAARIESKVLGSRVSVWFQDGVYPRRYD
jgi:hypothetical protein